MSAIGAANGHAAREEEGPIMTDPEQGREAQQVTARMRAIESVFAASGLTTHLTGARTGPGLSAVPGPPGTREAEIRVGENGYVEVRYWSPKGSTPEQVATTALRALYAVTGATAAELARLLRTSRSARRPGARKAGPQRAWRHSSMSVRSRSLAGRADSCAEEAMNDAGQLPRRGLGSELRRLRDLPG